MAAKVRVLVETEAPEYNSTGFGFEAFEAAESSESEAYNQARAALEPAAGLGVEPTDTLGPIPMFSANPPREKFEPTSALHNFTSPIPHSDIRASTVIVPAEIDRDNLDDLRKKEGIVAVWANSRQYLYQEHENDTAQHFDLARSRKGIDCGPFRTAVDLATVRQLLGVSAAWRDGFRGQNIVVGIVDDGVNGATYPVTGGFSKIDAPAQPGAASVTSHGSMCAADVLVAAPAAQIHDYPFLGIADSGGALRMYTAMLDQRRMDGTPHIVSNSYGFVATPPKKDFPQHEIWDREHALHRAIREVTVAGATVFFAAGNCGKQCPDRRCHPTAIGPGISIQASNSLDEVITIAAVNSRHERLGYSAQGPGRFAHEKPDFAAYTHFFGNFGVNRPGGTEEPCDSGTSAAAPLAAGVAALLLSAFPNLSAAELRTALHDGAINVTGGQWDPDYGHGIVNAAASYSHLLRSKAHSA